VTICFTFDADIIGLIYLYFFYFILFSDTGERIILFKIMPEQYNRFKVKY